MIFKLPNITLVIILLIQSCSSGKTNNPPPKTNVVCHLNNQQDSIPNFVCGKFIYVKNIPLPKDYKRIKATANSFEAFLQNLKLKQQNNDVKYFDGQIKPPGTHWAVIDMDIGKRNLQQCADAVIRLRAEYLYAQGKFCDISFKLTNGQAFPFSKYSQGYRPKIVNNKLLWSKVSVADSSYSVFRKYLDFLFTYAGSYSLSKELFPRDWASMQIGDVFIQGGFPGHAIIVLDMAENIKTHEKIFLLAQSYMPAQEIHILKNPSNTEISPWYLLNPSSDYLSTPQWDFQWTDLKHF